MANFFYIDSSGKKHGPINGQYLKTLAIQGTITSETIIETENGKSAPARKVSGLTFVETAPSITPPPIMPSSLIPTAQVPPAANPFCTNCGNSVPKQAVACMSCGARPTGQKKFCHQCGISLNPEQIVCIRCGTAIADISNVSSVAKTSRNADRIKTLNNYFMVFWVGMAIALPLFYVSFCISIMLIGETGKPGREFTGGGRALANISGMVAVITGIGTIAGFVSGNMLLHQLWKLIPMDIARTTPDKAIVASFIPFGTKVAFMALGEDMNKTLRRHGIQYQVNEHLGKNCCCHSLSFLLLIPIGIPAFIVLIFFLKSVKGGAIALLEHEGV